MTSCCDTQQKAQEIRPERPSCVDCKTLGCAHNNGRYPSFCETRGMTDEDEVMFTMKAERVSDVVSGLNILSNAHFGYQELAMDMPMNFPRPEFYNKMFEKWGLDTGIVWRKQDGAKPLGEE